MKLKKLMIVGVIIIILASVYLISKNVGDWMYFKKNITEISVGELMLIIYAVSGVTFIIHGRK